VVKVCSLFLSLQSPQPQLGNTGPARGPAARSVPAPSPGAEPCVSGGPAHPPALPWRPRPHGTGGSPGGEHGCQAHGCQGLPSAGSSPGGTARPAAGGWLPQSRGSGRLARSDTGLCWVRSPGAGFPEAPGLSSALAVALGAARLPPNCLVSEMEELM